MYRFLFALSCVLGHASVAIAQVNSDPNVFWPKSSIYVPGEKPGTAHTQYLIYRGPWTHTSIDDPFPGLFPASGPSLLSGPAGYHPADIHAAYNTPISTGKGAIAVVLWNDQVNILGDFNTFSKQFNLPYETSTNRTASSNKVFQVVYASGVQPPGDQGAGVEESLDVEWTHAMAPNAKIYLVEAADASDDSLMQAERVAASLPGVTEVSNSWIDYGGFDGETQLDGNFEAPNVLYFAGAGDIGGLNGWPSESPNVVSVGGTSLFMSNGTVTSETVWNGTGGGPSLYEPRPAFQNGVASLVGNFRGTPDLAAVADPGTGVAIYDSYGGGGWLVVGGTSVATPVTAGMMNGRGYVEKNVAAMLPRYYGLNEDSKYLRDIVSGSAGSFSAAVGWDFCTGNGAPLGYLPLPVVPMNVLTATTYAGSFLSGALSSFSAVDGNYWTIESAAQSGLGQVAGLTATFQIAFTNPSYTSISSAYLQIVSSAPITATEGIWLLNVNTSAYDFIEYVRPGVFVPAQIPVDPTKYVSASGNVSVIVRALEPTVKGLQGPSFPFKIDQLQLEAIPNVS